MTKLTLWVLGHRKLVVAFWVIVTLVGIALAGPANKSMDQKFSVPGREGWTTNGEIAHLYNQTGGNGSPLITVVTLPEGTKASDVKPQLAAVEKKMATALPGSRIAGYGSTGSAAFVSKDGRTAFAVIHPPADPDAIFGENSKAEKKARAAIAGTKVDGAPVHLTGYDALSNQSGESNGPGVLLEAMVGGLGALIVLGFVFASLLAFVPLLMALPAILTSFLLVYAMTTVTDVSPIVSFLIALIGLGVAIDYSLIIAVRWREERTHGHAGDQAIIRAMDTAGRAVVFSGTTVAIGLLALIALPLPFLRSVGIGGMLIPLVSVAVALTLLPVILHTLGPRLDWPHKRTDDKASRAWTRWATAVVKNRWAAAIIALAVLGVLVLAASNMNPGAANLDTVAKSGDAKEGLVALKDSGIGSGVLFPIEILVKGGAPEQTAQAVAKVDGVYGAVAPTDASWRADGTAVVDAFSSPDPSTSESRDQVAEVRQVAHGESGEARVGGQQSGNKDFIDAVYENFPLMIVLISVITFILLARAFRSLLLPLKAVVLNMISVVAAWGVLELVWQEGHGSSFLFGIDPTGAVTSWIPLMTFAFLFGLSMDYEVFILARMREEYDATGDTDEAVIRGIGRTGRLVTSAALILFLAFVSMASGPQTDVKVMATGLAAGILIDATVIRALLVPAVVSLFGRWNWVLPALPARLLRVEPSPKPAPAES